MPEQANTPLYFVGCDVGKAEVVVFDGRVGSCGCVANTPKALANWAAGLDCDGLVVCEATGGYEAELLAALAKVGAPVHRADARKVKAFIRSFGTLGKTDEIDARALAQYGAERCRQLARWSAPDETRLHLQSLVSARRDLVAQRTASSNRLKAPGGTQAKPYFTALVACLDEQIAAIDRHIARLIAEDANLAQAAQVLGSVPGIGAKTAPVLLALMPELGACSGKQAASLAGLAPHPRQSGANDAYRRVRGGRPEVKRALFMAAMAAATRSKAMKDVYQRLIDKGKKPLVAIIAIMRKMIVIANARIRDANIGKPASI